MIPADIASLPLAEKLSLMEALWDSLCRETSECPPIPAWHEAVLAERLERLASGAESVSPWSEAKERLREQIKAG
ncbi:MAG: addiction module protein [Rhodocyclaceae bacterium]|nr:addiction module protein [Rhodocyclaceae bacterium]